MIACENTISPEFARYGWLYLLMCATGSDPDRENSRCFPLNVDAGFDDSVVSFHTLTLRLRNIVKLGVLHSRLQVSIEFVKSDYSAEYIRHLYGIKCCWLKY